MNDYNLSSRAEVRVGIPGIWLSVRRPSRMPNTDRSFDRRFLEESGQARKFPRIAPYLNPAMLQYRKPRRVIPTVFEAL
jgi:hypothetical protein